MATEFAQPTLWDAVKVGPRGKSLEDQFWEFHEANPAVFAELRRLALELKERGRAHYGIKSLIEVLRWHRAITTTEEEYKINNNWAPFYSRLLMEKEPALEGFFEVRVQTYQTHEVG